MHNFLLTKTQRDEFLTNWKQLARDKQITSLSMTEFHLYHSSTADIHRKLSKAFSRKKDNNYYNTVPELLGRLAYRLKLYRNKGLLTMPNLELTDDQLAIICEKITRLITDFKGGK